jgi:hypothetical protein
VHVAPAEQRGALRSVEGYQALLKGRVLLGQRGRAIVDAIPCLERAVALDPEMVDGWALLGDAYRRDAATKLAHEPSRRRRGRDRIDQPEVGRLAARRAFQPDAEQAPVSSQAVEQQLGAGAVGLVEDDR